MKKLIVLTVICSFVHLGLDAQIGASLGLDQKKEQIYNNKRDKSPAKDLIIESDKKIEFCDDLKHQIKGFDKEAKILVFIENYNFVKESKNQILVKDPKWKTNKIDEFILNEKAFYDECQQKQSAFLSLESKFQILEAFFSTKEKMFNEAFSGRRSGSFFEFVSGKNENQLQWDLIQSKIEEAKTIEGEYFRALDKRMQSHGRGMDGLEFFTKHYRLESEAIDFVKEETNALKNADMDKFSVFAESKELLDKAKGFYFLYPNTNGLETAKNNFERIYNELDTKYSKFATSSFHKEHMGEFMLSNHPIKIGSESISDFTTTFNAGDAVYITYYGYKNFKVNSCNEFRLEKDDKVLAFDCPIIIGPNENALSVSSFALIPKADDKTLKDENKISMYEYVKALQALGEGTHDLVIRMGEYSADPTIEFTIDLTNQQEKLAALRKDIETVNFNYIRMPKPGMSDPSLTEIVREGFQAEGEKHNVLETIIITDRWIINRHTYTNQEMSRELQEVAIVCKDAKGCYMIIAHIGRAKKDSGGYEPASIAPKKTYRMTGNIWFTADEDYKLYFNCDNK